MKHNLLNLFPILLVLSFLFSASQETTAQVSFQKSKAYTILAQDSSLANAGSKSSITQAVFSKGASVTTTKIFNKGARILVMGNQTNDSVHANIYINIGQITSGTVKKTYAKILIDSLTLTKNYANIDLSSYLVYPEVSVTVTGAAAGNGYLAKWSAIFGGVAEYVIDK
jgi:hypothetical protein